MTLATENRRVQYDGNGSTTEFAFSNRFDADGDLVVVLTSAAGTDTTQTITTHYTVAGAGEATGGTVTMLTAPASGETLTIYRDLDLVQSADLTNQEAYYLSALEACLDKLTMMVQQVEEEVSRCVKREITSSEDTLTIEEFEAIQTACETAQSSAETAVTSAEAHRDAAEDIVQEMVGKHYETDSVADQTVYTLPFEVDADYDNLAVYADGVRQRRSTYSVTDTDEVTFDSAFSAGVELDFVSVDLGDALSDVTDAASSAAAAAASETAAAASETAAAASESAAETAETNALASAAAALAGDVPSFSSGDEGKALTVNSALNGYDLTGPPITGDADGRVLRAIEILIEDGTDASSVKCTVSSKYNGEAIASSDNIGYSDNVNGIALSSNGYQLWIGPGQGQIIGVLSADITARESTTSFLLDYSVFGDTNINLAFREDLTSNYIDLTTIADSGIVRIVILYVTSA
jgi:hypothetical protein